MPTPFDRTLRSLDTDGFRPSLVAFAVAAALVAVWLVWFLAAELPLYELSESARLEAAAAAHPIASPVLGRIVSSRLELGLEVQAGEVLVELDAEPERLRLEQERRQISTLAAQLEALAGEVTVERRALAAQLDGGRAARDEARARVREAEAVAALAAQEAERIERLLEAGMAAELEALRARAEASRSRSAVEGQRLAVARLERDLGVSVEDRRARIAALEGALAELEGRAAATTTAVARLAHEVDRRQLRAPVAGRVGEMAELRVGAVVDEGERLGAIVPPGGVRIVASFAPATALGRVRPGQPARLRLEGFSWAQFGTVAATVTAVASELERGRIRVELELTPATSTLIPLEHGLPGVVEVEIERVSPAELVLRAAGRRLARPVGDRGVPLAGAGA